ncbi:MAG: flavodoxin [Clostridiaceae bacterium]
MSNKKILIVHYSLQGHTKEIASNIKELTGGDIFEIELEKPYNLATAYTVGLVHAKKGTAPTLKNHLANINDYDAIFIGSPIWWYTISPPILSFIEEYNLENKIIIPFCTHAGNFGDYFEKFNSKCSRSKVLKGNDFHNKESKDKKELKSKVENWVLEVLSNS